MGHTVEQLSYFFPKQRYDAENRPTYQQLTNIF